MIYLILLICSIWFSDASSELSTDRIIHDIHMSRCDIDYRTDQGAIEISVKIFIDDLELDLRSAGHDSLKICTSYEKPDAETIIFQYLQQNLGIIVDGEPTELIWVGKEISEDLSAVWCYLMISDIKAHTSIEVTNEILLSVFDDQQNVVKLRIDDGKRSFFLFDRKEFRGLVKIG